MPAYFWRGTLVGLPLAVLTFFAAFVPFLGVVIAGGAAALVALASGGFVVALFVIGATAGVQQVEGTFVQPLVMSRAVRLHPVAVLLSVVTGAALAGIVGAFLAVPVVAVTTVVIRHVGGRLEPAVLPAGEPPAAG